MLHFYQVSLSLLSSISFISSVIISYPSRPLLSRAITPQHALPPQKCCTCLWPNPLQTCPVRLVPHLLYLLPVSSLSSPLSPPALLHLFLGMLYKSLAEAATGMDKLQLVERAEEALKDALALRTDMLGECG